jgi:hypothetical protein
MTYQAKEFENQDNFKIYDGIITGGGEGGNASADNQLIQIAQLQNGSGERSVFKLEEGVSVFMSADEVTSIYDQAETINDNLITLTSYLHDGENVAYLELLYNSMTDPGGSVFIDDYYDRSVFKDDDGTSFLRKLYYSFQSLNNTTSAINDRPSTPICRVETFNGVDIAAVKVLVNTWLDEHNYSLIGPVQFTNNGASVDAMVTYSDTSLTI